jgi:hypothetical protein
VNLKKLRDALIVGAALALFGFLPAASAATDAIAVQDSQEVSRLLREARTSARKLAVTTDEFHSYTRSKMDWRSHAVKAHQVKREVNALGVTVKQLEAMKAEAALWQREAIESIKPIALELAQNTQFVIERINESPKHLGHPEYKDALASKFELATQLASMMDDYVRYGETKTAFEELESKLELN